MITITKEEAKNISSLLGFLQAMEQIRLNYLLENNATEEDTATIRTRLKEVGQVMQKLN
ncbi:hypothetical protein EDC18_102389 [Natranaerovirga pectinivora]|uniref:50S ribosomal protein L29 n=1 Tax=Natranaerovirga pectinivora TaxID=682400 RepID=A0A4R3MP74_9FIRM|nr:hypothetical protein [Natranaerovirga pectinivora]TCT16370.1 hypothetical protein EDC18_102389 [Natranaerovirga pectinivora]